jgi:ribosome-associated toxin RatA of RatAB toxin-antitoxin module
MPVSRSMITVDEAVVAAPIARLFALAREVEAWPTHLPHYRFVRFRARTRDGGGLVEMSANRPFGSLNWPTWWLSQMSVDERAPAVRYRHVDGVTAGMDVQWTFERAAPGDDARTRVRIVHAWDGPRWPVIGTGGRRRRDRPRLRPRHRVAHARRPRPRRRVGGVSPLPALLLQRLP